MFQGAAIFILGLLFGSFANVCIWRIPRKEEIVFTPSHCPKCLGGIKWYDNVPVLSYLLLGRKCRSCKAEISWRYPVIELMSGLLFLGVYLRFGPEWRLVGYIPFVWAMLVISAIDIEHYIIPDVISLSGLALGLLFALGATFGLPLDLSVFGSGDILSRWPLLDSAIGVIMGGGFLWLAAWVGEKVFRQEAMGGGDIKLAAMIGAFFGWKAILVGFFMAFLSGSIAGIVLIIIGKAKNNEAPDGVRPRAMVPFGPFLALGGIISLFWGKELLNLYLSLFGF
jgi:leader peptidase (prepilin peptidase)/N-methyltransferase